MLATHANNKATLAKISTARKMAKYLGPVLLVVARTTKPMNEVNAARAQNGPLILKRSESQQSVRMTKKQSRYGGAESPCDWMDVKVPISEMMVGTKSGKDANETLLQPVSAYMAQSP